MPVIINNFIPICDKKLRGRMRPRVIRKQKRMRFFGKTKRYVKWRV